MPADRTPAGDEMDEVRPTPRFPEREPGESSGRVERHPDVAHRPPLPDHGPADRVDDITDEVKDENGGPVLDQPGAGISDGPDMRGKA